MSLTLVAPFHLLALLGGQTAWAAGLLRGLDPCHCQGAILFESTRPGQNEKPVRLRRISGLPCLHDRLECVTELRASDGTTLGTFNVGHTPFDILFDGTNIWTSNESGGSNDSSLTKLRASDGALLGTFPMDGPRGLAFDGQSIWVANNSDQTVTKFRPSDGAIELVVPVRTYPTGICFDGRSIWVCLTGYISPGKRVTKILASDGSIEGEFPVDTRPFAITSDGTNVWVGGAIHHSVTEYA